MRKSCSIFPAHSPIRQVTDNDYADLYPDISWDVASEKVTLCWQGRTGPDNTFEIFTLGYKTPLRLTNNAFDDTNPKIWGTHIAWSGQHNLADWEIFRHTPTLGVVQLTKDSLDDYPRSYPDRESSGPRPTPKATTARKPTPLTEWISSA